MDRPSYWQILRDYPNPIRQALQHWLTSDLPLREEQPKHISPWCFHCGSPLKVHRRVVGEDGTGSLSWTRGTRSWQHTSEWRCTSQWRCRTVAYFDLPPDGWKELLMGWLDPDGD